MSIKRGVVAAGGGFTGSLLRIGVQLAATLVIARLLGPTVYGVYAIAASVVGFAGFFSDFGVSYSLIQKPEVTSDDERICFSWSVFLGLIVALALVAIAPLLAVFFRTPDATGAIRWLSIALLAQSISSLPANLLRRQLRNKTLQIRQAIAYFLGYVVVGIPAAYAGAGIWALVAAWIVQAWITVVLLHAARPVDIKPLFMAKGAAGLLFGGGLVFLTNLLNWTLVNIDRAVVGRIFSNHAMGVYANAMNLSWQGTTAAHVNVQSVFFASLRHATGNSVKVWAAARSLFQIVIFLIAPAFVALSAMGTTLVHALFGTAWLAAAPLFSVLMLGMPAYLVLAIATPIIWAIGRPRNEVLLQLPLLPVWIGTVAWAAQQSMEAVAVAVVVMYILRAAILLWGMARACQESAVILMLAFLRAAVVWLAVWLLVRAFDELIALATDFVLPRLMLDIMMVIATLVFLARSAKILLDDEAMKMFTSAVAALPAPLARCLLKFTPHEDSNDQR